MGDGGGEVSSIDFDYGTLRGLSSMEFDFNSVRLPTPGIARSKSLTEEKLKIPKKKMNTLKGPITRR